MRHNKSPICLGGCSCEAENPATFRWSLTMYRFFNRLRAAARYRGFRCSGHALYWPWPVANASRPWLSRCHVTHRRSGASVGAMNRAGLKVYYRTRRARAIQWRFPPLQRAQIVQLACLEPIAKGLHITHWTSQDLARQAVAEGIVPQLSACSVRRILREIPSSIEQQEFEYVRHGTVNVLLFLIVHSGRMEATCPAYKDADHYIQALHQFRQHHRHLRGVFLIQDGDPSHTAAATEHYFQQQSWWRPRFTPVHASWLNQAELLNDAFSFHYLKRGSWHSRQELIDHIEAAWPEYNELYAHPFEWTWTNQNMRRWFAEHATDHV